MKTVVTSICNSLMAVSIANLLRETGDFAVRSVNGVPGSTVAQCESDSADVALLEVAYNPGFTIEERISQANALHAALPECKVMLICDENSSPELARQVARAKRDGSVDDFIYSSVSESYFTAMMYAI